jgi:hypothetical protein
MACHVTCGVKVVQQCFRGTYSRHLHAGSKQSVATLKMEAACFSERSVNYQTTRYYTPEDDTLHSHNHQNLKSHTGIDDATELLPINEDKITLL